MAYPMSGNGLLVRLLVYMLYFIIQAFTFSFILAMLSTHSVLFDISISLVRRESHLWTSTFFTHLATTSGPRCSAISKPLSVLVLSFPKNHFLSVLPHQGYWTNTFLAISISLNGNVSRPFVVWFSINHLWLLRSIISPYLSEQWDHQNVCL